MGKKDGECMYHFKNESDEVLLDKIEELKKDLSGLRINKAIGTTNRNSKIKNVRKNIARILTIYNQRKKQELRNEYKGKKFKPVNLRPKLTKNKRLQLTKKQKSAISLKQKKVRQNFPQRRYLLVSKE